MPNSLFFPAEMIWKVSGLVKRSGVLADSRYASGPPGLSATGNWPKGEDVTGYLNGGVLAGQGSDGQKLMYVFAPPVPPKYANGVPQRSLYAKNPALAFTSVLPCVVGSKDLTGIATSRVASNS
jgi:hypothetical protein